MATETERMSSEKKHRRELNKLSNRQQLQQKNPKRKKKWNEFVFDGEIKLW